MIARDNLQYEKYLKEGFFFMEQLKEKEAMERWDKAIDLMPDRPEAYVWLADCVLHYGDGPIIAEEITKKGLKKNEKFAALHIMYCMVLEYLLEDYSHDSHYIHHLEYTIQLEPTWPWPKLMLAAAFIEQRKLTTARNILEELKKNLDIRSYADEMKDYWEHTFTGNSNLEIPEYIDIYLKAINKEKY